jgi:hypothetical protein
MDKYVKKTLDGKTKVFVNGNLFNIYFKEAGILLEETGVLSDIEGSTVKIPKDWMKNMEKLGAKNRFVLHTSDGDFVFQIKEIVGMGKKRDLLMALIYEKYLKSPIPEEGWD